MPGNGLPPDLIQEVKDNLAVIIAEADEEARAAGRLPVATGQTAARRKQGDISPTNDTSPAAIIQAHREVEVVKLRLQGLDMRSIARRMGLVSEKTGQPKVATVHAMLTRALQRWFAEDVEELRSMEMARLDKITERIWPIIEREGGKGDDDRSLRAIERYLAVSERRAKLVGLDAPVKTQQTFKGEVAGEVVVRVEAIEAVDEYLGLVDEILATEHQYATAIDVQSTVRDGEIGPDETDDEGDDDEHA